MDAENILPESLKSEHQTTINKVYAAGQEHVFRFWDELNSNQQENLLAELAEIDFDLMSELNSKFVQIKDHNLFVGHLEPAEFIRRPGNEEERAAFAKAKAVGEEALRSGKVAAFLVAGGQGTRLGFTGPKGMFPVSPVKNKTLFQLHAEKILATSRRYDTTIPWYIMTSETNHDETVAFFEKQRFFGLNPQKVIFFKQEMIPAMDAEGRLILDAKNHVFRNPNGHGGSLSALNKSGALDEMKRLRIEHIFYFQVDNVLVKICDPVFIGFHILENSEMSAKIVAKTEPGEKVGVCGLVDGKLGVIEYSDLSEEEKNARNADGSLKYQAGSIAIHIFNVDFIERENRGGLQLPWHVAHKKISFIDETGISREPETPNGFKFETFVFDALGDASKATILEVEREDEFSPVKNALGVSSVETAKLDMINEFNRWLSAAGAEPVGHTTNHEIEISPLFALDAEELRTRIEAGINFKKHNYYE